MATELISYGSGEATSADITVADGSTATVFLKSNGALNPKHDAEVFIEVKDGDGNYNIIGSLTQLNRAALISGKGTYRLRRSATSDPVGAGQG